MNRTKKVAVIGAGRMGRYHIRVLSRLGSLAAIVDTNQNCGRQNSDENGTQFFTDYRTMLDEVQPNGVIIATPTHHHFHILEDLLQNYSLDGILVEKPVSSTIEEGQRLLRLAQDSSTAVSVGHIEVYNPVVKRTIDMFHQGTLGELRTLFFQRRGAVSDGRLDSIGDVYQDIGIHDFDIASRFLNGSAKLSAFALNRGDSDIVNTSTVVLNTNNMICTFLLSREYAGKVRRVELEGTKATMVVDLLDQYIQVRQLGIAKGDTKSISVPYGSGEHIKVYGEPLLEEIWQFLDTMSGASPLVSIQDGIRGLKMVEAAREAAKTGCEVELVL